MNAAELVKQFEGYRSKAYLCPAGKWTCGWGHTKGVTAATSCDFGTAETWLCDDLTDAGNCIDRVVTVPLTPNQRAALLSFIYNVGCGRFEASTLLRKLNEGDYEGCSQEFSRWVFSGKTKLPGLIRRREAERTLFQDGGPLEPMAA